MHLQTGYQIWQQQQKLKYIILPVVCLYVKLIFQCQRLSMISFRAYCSIISLQANFQRVKTNTGDRTSRRGLSGVVCRVPDL